MAPPPYPWNDFWRLGGNFKRTVYGFPLFSKLLCQKKIVSRNNKKIKG